MQIETKFFEQIEIGEKDIITFEDGIPGFPDLRKFALLHDNQYLSYFQSVNNKGVCFVVIPPAAIVENYDIEISDDAVVKLGVEKPDDVAIYAIVNLSEDMNKITANLKAPLLINEQNNKGVQEILDDSRYDIRHKIMKEADASC